MSIFIHWDLKEASDTTFLFSPTKYLSTFNYYIPNIWAKLIILILLKSLVEALPCFRLIFGTVALCLVLGYQSSPTVLPPKLLLNTP